MVHRCRALVSLNLCGVVRLQGDCIPALPLLLPKLKLLDLEQCPDVELADLQDLVRKNLSLVVKDYYGERVSPCRTLREYLIDHPEVEFVTYDHEEDEGHPAPYVSVSNKGLENCYNVRYGAGVRHYQIIDEIFLENFRGSV